MCWTHSCKNHFFDPLVCRSSSASGSTQNSRVLQRDILSHPLYNLNGVYTGNIWITSVANSQRELAATEKKRCRWRSTSSLIFQPVIQSALNLITNQTFPHTPLAICPTCPPSPPPSHSRSRRGSTTLGRLQHHPPGLLFPANLSIFARFCNSSNAFRPVSSMSSGLASDSDSRSLSPFGEDRDGC